MDSQTLQAIADHISKNEGPKDYPYLDNTGKITAGVGQNVDNWNDFKQVNFTNRSTGLPASEAQKRTGYDALSAAKQTMTEKSADQFKTNTALTLPKAEQDALLKSRILADEPKVRATLGTDANGNSVYDKLTEGQKAAMSDIQYSNKGGLNGFPNLIQAAKDGTLDQNYKEADFKSGDSRNWDRTARNRAAIQGISFEQAQPGVAQDYQSDPHLADKYKQMLPAAGKTGDAGTGTDDGTDIQTADQTGGDTLPPVDDETAKQLAEAPDLPPEGTPANQTFADITGDDAPIQFAAMGKTLNDFGGQDASAGGDGTGTDSAPSTLLTYGNTPTDLMDQASVVPDGTPSSFFAQDLTGDPDPLSFAAFGSTLNQMGGDAPNPTLLGGGMGEALA